MNRPADPSAFAKPKPRKKVRAFWLKQLHTWHWMSAAISLVATMLFAITGITLNHAAAIETTPVVATRAATLPAPLRATIADPAATGPLPVAVVQAVKTATGLDTAGRAAEWSADEVYVALPRPGGDGWVSIDRASGAIASETTDRGWISYLNDLHKGRNAGTGWSWFIDGFAIACIVFTLTGLILLQLHARHRPSTWPLVAAGLVLPALIAVFLIH